MSFFRKRKRDDWKRETPVIIIGAGIIGLTLAQALQARSIPYLIYERDPTASHRGPGWALSIHWAKAILEFLLPQSIYTQLTTAYVDPEAVEKGERGAFVHYDALTGSALFKVPPSERLRLRREAFRQVLLSDIDVQWSKAFSGFSETGEDAVIVQFDDGTCSPPGAIVVGCDGSRSRVRQILLPDSSDNNLLPVNCLGVTVVLPTSEALPMKKLDPYFMQMGDVKQNVFVFFSFLDGPSNNTRAEPDSYACQVFMSWPSSFHDVPAQPLERITLMKDLTRNWAEPFRSVIKAIPDNTFAVTLPLEDWQPIPWDNHGGAITLAGDSSHAMTMYRGEGFNQGLADLRGLVQKLEEIYVLNEISPEQRKSLIDTYEKDVYKRTYPAVLASRRACLDAHDQVRINDKSPLVALRAMRLEALQ